MSSALYTLDVAAKTLAPLRRRTLSELGLSEPRDLETWLATAKAQLFGRDVLWITRQDSPSHDQRSDLIGVDRDGNVLIAELKAGQVTENAITQALAYAAEYGQCDADMLAERFVKYGQRFGSAGQSLVVAASDVTEAKQQLSQHVGDTELNDTQVILLVGEDFSATALSICTYLSEAIIQATFTIECWQYGIFEAAPGHRHLLIEQVFPPSNVREQVEEKREAARQRKYARDPVRCKFMQLLLQHVQESGRMEAWRNRGSSYACFLRPPAVSEGLAMVFSNNDEHPRLAPPPGWHWDPLPIDVKTVKRVDKGIEYLEFSDVAAENAVFSEAFAERLMRVVEAVTVKTVPVDIRGGGASNVQ